MNKILRVVTWADTPPQAMIITGALLVVYGILSLTWGVGFLVSFLIGAALGAIMLRDVARYLLTRDVKRREKEASREHR